MPCTDPRTVGFKADGKTISWSPKTHSKQFAPFQLPCGQCIECRLDYARSWAIRCVHESQMHEKSCFITLTYSDDNLKSPKLDYSDFQKFMKKLRKTQNDPIGVFVTGEYGDKTKRPHWHAILFNYRPPDETPLYTHPRGDTVYHSESLTKIWSNGRTEHGIVNMQTAGYCARYAAKKLSHDKEFNEEFKPISKKSSKHAIGKKWLEKYWPDVFNHGYVQLPDSTKIPIPRYYEKWLKEHQPEHWKKYVTEIRPKKIAKAIAKAEELQLLENQMNSERKLQNQLSDHVQTFKKMKTEIVKSKFNQLQKKLKL